MLSALRIRGFCATISNMNGPLNAARGNSRQSGSINLLVIPLVLVTLLLFGVAAIAYTSYNEAADYKNNVAQKVEVEADKARVEISTQKDKEFAEKEKFPYDRYEGPAPFGALRILYPKTWSAYVNEPRNSGGRPVEGYFSPGHVPGVADANNTFALRVVVEQRTYDATLKEYQGKVKEAKVVIRPYQSPNVPNVVGSRIDGEVVTKKQGAMIVMPMRDKTLRMWTESRDYVPDFDNIILPNFTFTP